jgi:hypothetical protein
VLPVREENTFSSLNNTGEENRKGGELSMSAFIVADKTINNIVTWLDSALAEAYGTITIRHKLLELGFDASVAGWAERLGYAMFQLNVIAVAARYGSGEAKKFRPLDYRYRLTHSVPLVQVLKSLQCWLYQCNEGDVPQTALYGLFDNDVQVYLMTEIIDALPEYQSAIWGKRNAIYLTDLWMRNIV